MSNSTTNKNERQISEREMTLFIRLVKGIEMDILAKVIALYEDLSPTQIADDFGKNRGKLSSRSTAYKKKLRRIK